MYLLKKIPIIVEMFILVFSVLFFAVPAKAFSCQCFERIQSTVSFTDVPYTKVPYPYCRQNIYIDKCNPLSMSFSERICEPNQAGLLLCHDVICKAYRDNDCQQLVGTTNDTSSIFNNCWTKDQCDNVGGDFDSDRKDSSNCTAPTARCFVKTPNIDLQIPIPGYGSVVSGGFPGYLAAFYKFFIAMLAVVSVVMVMWGGFKRIMAAGSPERIKDANDAIISAITGLVLALISYTLLNLVNPSLVNFTRLKLDKVKTELFGNWCPDPDLTNPNIRYQCGDKATINGLPCIGMVCQEGTGGCHKISNTGDTDKKGFSEDYKCLKPKDLCESIDKKVAHEVYGLPLYMSMSDWDAQMTAMEELCSRFSNKGDVCFYNLDKCAWFAKQDITSFCAGKTKCTDFNSVNDVSVRYLACKLHVCPLLQSCKYTAVKKNPGTCQD